MDLKDEGSNTPNSANTAPNRVYKLIAGSCLLAITLYWVVRSYTEPGGVLHGARIWSRPYMHTRFGFGSHPQNMTFNDDDNGCDLHDPNEQPLPAIRTEFGSIATIVYGWPSTGGVWVHEDCYGVELDFLALSRFEPSATERFSPEEDEFCKRLEWIGGRFYESELAYNRQRSRRQQLWYAWPGAVPEGGVWVLSTQVAEEAELGVSRIRNALTMKERCEAIQMLGGKFYEKWEDVAGASPTAK